MHGNCEKSKAVRGLSNTAKLLKAYMAATGVACAKTLSEALDIPLRTIQRLKLDIATCATSAMDGVLTCATSATRGVFEAPNAPPVASAKERVSPHTPLPKENYPHLEDRLSTTTQHSDARARVADAALRLDWRSIGPRITEACNGALANPATAPGLLSMATPMMWIDQGADLDRDVIPTLTAAGQKFHGKGIRSWDYFTGMIAEAKAKREAGLPVVAVNQPAAKAGGLREALRRRVAQRTEVAA